VVRRGVALLAGVDPATRDDLLAREKAYSQQWQRSGHWPHIWRCVGQYANLSIFEVESNEQLHQILWGLPLFPYMTISVTPLAGHPSDIALAGPDVS
jgi:muconolactone D-isomerase